MDDIKHALTAEFKVSLEINLDRTEFGVGEAIAPSFTIQNLGTTEVKVPQMFWSANVVLDGQSYLRIAESPWSGAGVIARSASYVGSIRLSESEFGIKPSALAPGEHKLALRIGDDISKEVAFTIRSEKPKVSLKIDADQVTYSPGDDVVVMITIGNLGPTDIAAPATYWAARAVLEGKEYARLPKFIGDWNGRAVIIPEGIYRGAVSLAEYGIDSSALGSGNHKLVFTIGGDKSNELTFMVQDERPATVDQEGASALLKKQLADISAMKPGGNREDLLKVFQDEGGLSTRTQRRYAYRANPSIKVDVTFEAVGMPGEQVTESPKDKVLTISKTFLEPPISDALTDAIADDKGKFQITIAGPADRVLPPSGDVELTITLRNLQTKKVKMFWVYSNTRVILDGKDIGQIGFRIDRGPSELAPQQAFTTTQTRALGKLAVGDHTLALRIGEDESNKLTITSGAADRAAAAPALRQVQSRQEERFGVQKIDPVMRDNKVWLDLKKRLETSGIKYRWVEVTEKGEFRLNLSATWTIDLAPLKGVPLTYLDLSNTAVNDLAPLEGMPLNVLDVSGTQIRSLLPLKGMNLVMLNLSRSRVSDLAPLSEAKLTHFTATNTEVADLSPLAKMPLGYLDIRSTAVTDLTPLVNAPLSVLEIQDCKVSDLTPLRKTPLRTLNLKGFDTVDLAQLVGSQIVKLTLSGKEIKDLTQLRGMKLESLRIVETNVKDISALKDMPLTELDLRDSPVSDLSPLKDMKLVSLYVSERGTDLAPVADMPLEAISIPTRADVRNIDVLRGSQTLKTIRSADKPIPAAEFWRLYDAGEFGKKAT